MSLALGLPLLGCIVGVAAADHPAGGRVLLRDVGSCTSPAARAEGNESERKRAGGGGRRWLVKSPSCYREMGKKNERKKKKKREKQNKTAPVLPRRPRGGG